MGSQYEASPEELARREAEWNREERRDDIRAAQDAWSDFNATLHHLGPLPPEILEGWDRVKPWIEAQAAEA
jgi:hypothetical protein